MPYYTSRTRTGWKTVDDNNAVYGEFKTKKEASQEMIALSSKENVKAGGEKGLPDTYRAAINKDVPPGGACGTCKYFDESKISDDNTQAWCTKWDDWADGGFYCDAWEAKSD